jgi:LmbE family N-acetylglucosaminyl deacetylase
MIVQEQQMEKILVLSPHTDDAELGAAGSIARFSDEGKEIFWVVFSTCEESVPAGFPKDILKTECLNSTRIMGIPPERVFMFNYQVRTFSSHRQEILEDMIKLRQQIKPDLVLIPSSNDMHQDHGTIYWEALRAFRKGASVWGYEHPWNNLTFTTDVFVRLDDRHIERKVQALKEYKSQGHRSYMDEAFLRALACIRGAQLDIPCAEAFELKRLLY